MKKLFYEPLKISGKDENILFWGCTHFGHACEKWEVPLWRRRGFESVEQHDEVLIKNWNSSANPETIGFLLGDVIFGKGAEERLQVIFQRLVFKNLFVMPGNHYSGWKQHFNSCGGNLKPMGSKFVEFVPNYLEVFCNGMPLALSHYPILSWNGMGNNSVHLFSHVHDSLKNSEIGRLYLKNFRCIETSVEVNPFPLTFGDIRKKMQDRETQTPDHHGPHTQNPFG